MRPILYSFRRCPYAIRARMGLIAADLSVELREVVLWDKPAAMLESSPKATVPVLLLANGDVIDESLEIMLWALNQRDGHGWQPQSQSEQDITDDLITTCDGAFKHHLDRFKYATRYEDVDPEEHRRQAHVFLQRLNTVLSQRNYLAADRITIADIAIFPFIRQYANADKAWDSSGRLARLDAWLSQLLESPTFKIAMNKYSQWKPNDQVTIFPAKLA